MLSDLKAGAAQGSLTSATIPGLQKSSAKAHPYVPIVLEIIEFYDRLTSNKTLASDLLQDLCMGRHETRRWIRNESQRLPNTTNELDLAFNSQLTALQKYLETIGYVKPSLGPIRYQELFKNLFGFSTEQFEKLHREVADPIKLLLQARCLVESPAWGEALALQFKSQLAPLAKHSAVESLLITLLSDTKLSPETRKILDDILSQPEAEDVEIADLSSRMQPLATKPLFSPDPLKAKIYEICKSSSELVLSIASSGPRIRSITLDLIAHLTPEEQALIPTQAPWIQTVLTYAPRLVGRHLPDPLPLQGLLSPEDLQAYSLGRFSPKLISRIIEIEDQFNNPEKVADRFAEIISDLRSCIELGQGRKILERLVAEEAPGSVFARKALEAPKQRVKQLAPVDAAISSAAPENRVYVSRPSFETNEGILVRIKDLSEFFRTGHRRRDDLSKIEAAIIAPERARRLPADEFIPALMDLLNSIANEFPKFRDREDEITAQIRPNLAQVMQMLSCIVANSVGGESKRLNVPGPWAKGKRTGVRGEGATNFKSGLPDDSQIMLPGDAPSHHGIHVALDLLWTEADPERRSWLIEGIVNATNQPGISIQDLISNLVSGEKPIFQAARAFALASLAADDQSRFSLTCLALAVSSERPILRSIISQPRHFASVVYKALDDSAIKEQSPATKTLEALAAFSEGLRQLTQMSDQLTALGTKAQSAATDCRRDGFESETLAVIEELRSGTFTPVEALEVLIEAPAGGVVDESVLVSRVIPPQELPPADTASGIIYLLDCVISGSKESGLPALRAALDKLEDKTHGHLLLRQLAPVQFVPKLIEAYEKIGGALAPTGLAQRIELILANVVVECSGEAPILNRIIGKDASGVAIYIGPRATPDQPNADHSSGVSYLLRLLLHRAESSRLREQAESAVDGLLQRALFLGLSSEKALVRLGRTDLLPLELISGLLVVAAHSDKEFDAIGKLLKLAKNSLSLTTQLTNLMALSKSDNGKSILKNQLELFLPQELVTRCVDQALRTLIEKLGNADYRNDALELLISWCTDSVDVVNFIVANFSDQQSLPPILLDCLSEWAFAVGKSAVRELPLSDQAKTLVDSLFSLNTTKFEAQDSPEPTPSGNIATLQNLSDGLAKHEFRLLTANYQTGEIPAGTTGRLLATLQRTRQPLAIRTVTASAGPILPLIIDFAARYSGTNAELRDALWSTAAVLLQSSSVEQKHTLLFDFSAPARAMIVRGLLAQQYQANPRIESEDLYLAITCALLAPTEQEQSQLLNSICTAAVRDKNTMFKLHELLDKSESSPGSKLETLYADCGIKVIDVATQAMTTPEAMQGYDWWEQTLARLGRQANSAVLQDLLAVDPESQLKIFGVLTKSGFICEQLAAIALASETSLNIAAQSILARILNPKDRSYNSVLVRAALLRARLTGNAVVQSSDEAYDPFTSDL